MLKLICFSVCLAITNQLFANDEPGPPPPGACQVKLQFQCAEDYQYYRDEDCGEISCETMFREITLFGETYIEEYETCLDAQDVLSATYEGHAPAPPGSLGQPFWGPGTPVVCVKKKACRCNLINQCVDDGTWSNFKAHSLVVGSGPSCAGS